MNEIAPTTSRAVLPRCDVATRAATMADLPFIDSLQKMHTHMVGWMPTKQLEGKIKAGHVLVAVGATLVSPSFAPQQGETSLAPTGYCIGNDQYFKRDDVGIIYQMNVAPGEQRSFIGATLLKAMFDRAAYGCRLFCCWCAQDIAANHFWESMGFVPLAFRAGSAAKSRVHIFWQKRIRSGDTTTPWWFPSQTSAGSIREDRLVFPIPPGTHWSDAKPIILPQVARASRPCLPEKKKAMGGTPMLRKQKRRAITATSGLRFPVAEDAVGEKKRAKKPREPKRKVKNDPKLVAAARELRDRYLEQINSGAYLTEAQGKYDVSRALYVNARGSRHRSGGESLGDARVALLA